MRRISTIALAALLLAGCTSPTFAERVAEDAPAEPPAATEPEPTVEEPTSSAADEVEPLVIERWADCFASLGTADASAVYIPNEGVDFPGTATVLTEAGVIVFDVGLSNTDAIITVPTVESADILATVGC